MMAYYSNKLLLKLLSFIQYGTRTEILVNEQMDITKAHGVLVVKNYREGEYHSTIPFKVTDSELLTYPSSRCIRSILRQAVDLGYDVVSIEFTVGRLRNRAFLFDTYLMYNPVLREEEKAEWVKATPVVTQSQVEHFQ